MVLRRGHGNGSGTPRIEVLPFDELPDGVAEQQPSPAAMPRPPYAKGSVEARTAGARGGRKKAGRTALAASVGLTKEVADPSMKPYISRGEHFSRLHVNRLAQTVGGGECGPGPSSIVWSAGWQLAMSRWAFEVMGDAALGSRLANDSRQNLLAAHELCAREAQARPKRAAAFPWLTAHSDEIEQPEAQDATAALATATTERPSAPDQETTE